MPKLKVKPLEWYMQADDEFLADMGYTPLPADFELIKRDGYYCRGDEVWFEFNGVGYLAYPNSQRKKAREHFCYTLTVNDEAILPSREVNAMQDVLKTTRSGAVRRALRDRLNLHRSAQELRDSGRNSALARIRILGR